MITNIGYKEKNLLDKRKRHEINSFEHLKLKKMIINTKKLMNLGYCIIFL